MSKIAYQHHRTGRIVYVDAEDPRVKKLDAGERWNRLKDQPAKAAPAPARRAAGESA